MLGFLVAEKAESEMMKREDDHKTGKRSSTIVVEVVRHSIMLFIRKRHIQPAASLQDLEGRSVAEFPIKRVDLRQICASRDGTRFVCEDSISAMRVCNRWSIGERF